MLNENLSRIRKEKGITQEALAVKLNVVRQTISKWENGTAVPDADTLLRIADALEVSVLELLGGAKPDENGKSYNDDVLARTLAEINEQLAIRNRRSKRIWRTIGWIVGTIFFLQVVLIGSNILFRFSTTHSVESSMSVRVE